MLLKHLITSEPFALRQLTAIVEDRCQEESLAQHQNAERQAKIEALRAQLLEDGIDPSELLGNPKTSRSAAVRGKLLKTPNLNTFHAFFNPGIVNTLIKERICHHQEK